MTKFVFVNYTGGYCGNFFTGLICEALGIKYESKVGDNNAYTFDNVGTSLDFVKMLSKLFEIRQRSLNLEDPRVTRALQLDQRYERSLQMYKILEDPSDDVFIENIKNYYSDFLSRIKADYYVDRIHYAFSYKGYSLTDIIPNAKVVYLYTEDPRLHRLFVMLFHYKTKDDEADVALQVNTLSEKRLKSSIDHPEQSILKPFIEGALNVDMGRIIFDRDESYVSGVEMGLSSLLDTNVTLNKKRLSDYAERNVGIIKSIVGDDFMSMSDSECAKACRRYLENNVRKNV